MQITCSAGKGELTTGACLLCSLNERPAMCGYDYSLLKALYGDDQDRSKEIHVTDLTGCLRKSWYDKTSPAAEYPHEMLARWIGSAIHSHAEGTDDYMTSELPLKLDTLVGTADVVYKNGVVVDHKTTRWMYVEKLPYGSHSLQVNIYAHMLRKMGHDPKQLFIQYIDVSGPTKCRKCRVPVRMVDGELKCPNCSGFPKGAHLGAAMVEVQMMGPHEIEAHITQRKEALEAALMFGAEPEREAGFLCAYCSHRSVCQPDVSEE